MSTGGKKPKTPKEHRWAMETPLALEEYRQGLEAQTPAQQEEQEEESLGVTAPSLEIDKQDSEPSMDLKTDDGIMQGIWQEPDQDVTFVKSKLSHECQTKLPTEYHTYQRYTALKKLREAIIQWGLTQGFVLQGAHNNKWTLICKGKSTPSGRCAMHFCSFKVIFRFQKLRSLCSFMGMLEWMLCAGDEAVGES